MPKITEKIWQQAKQKPLDKISQTLYHLTPLVPLTPELKLHHAIFGEKVRDNRGLLIELFTQHNEPRGEWEHYKDSCVGWVTDLLQMSIAHETDLIREPLHQALETLSPREKQALWLRFGFDGQGSRTLEQTAKEFHLTRERIRQIEAKALRKLRHPARSRHLKFSQYESLRDMIFTEFALNPAVPAMFLLWQGDREALKSQGESHMQAVAEAHKQADNRLITLQQERDYLKSLVSKVYKLPITEVPLSVRVRNALLRWYRFREGHWTEYIPAIGEVAVLTDDELLSIWNFGRKALAELREMIRQVAGEKDHA